MNDCRAPASELSFTRRATELQPRGGANLARKQNSVKETGSRDSRSQLIDTRAARDNDHDRPNLSVHREDAVLFGAVFPEPKPGYEKPLEELKRLADTAGARVKSSLVQKRAKVHPTTFVGPGMVERINEVAQEVGAELLIADNDLSPAQAFNIEKRTGKRVVDRSELILDIFASHARSRIAKVAVELAQLEYALPRLKRLWTHLEKQKGGIGLRGPGETQIETDRRIVKKKIADLRRVLLEIQARKTREVRAREGEFKVSLVGYTNAGKSTLMGALSGRDVYVKDQLFATLDTKTALVEILKNRRILLSDTVGFIQNIPHHLIASFHATLEEVTEADLLLHVIDASHPDPKSQIEAVNEVLRGLGCFEKPTIAVLNKADAVADQIEIEFLKRTYPDNVVISAKTGLGIDALRQKIAGKMATGLEEVELRFSVSNGRAIAFLRDRAEVLEERFEGE
ncbi:MAG TPA: GTPase HflX, partial [Planctomycetota bacterium]|nr:GTPase HflX [Planctomycetota bacterium]